MKKIPLTQGKFVKVDNEDYKNLNQWKWYATTGHSKTFYAYRQVNNKAVIMHRIIMKAETGQFIDHKDGNGLNNQKSNLRFCTPSQNSKNKKSSGISKYLGVYKHTSHKKYFSKKQNKTIKYSSRPIWVAHIKHNEKYIHLGVFEIEIEAAKAYNEAAKIYHGEFARLNIILTN
jgi:hypothetical protein